MQGQEEWVPCVFELETQPGKVDSSLWTIRNVDDTDVNLSFVLPLPTRRGGRRLHIAGITVGVQDTGPGDFVPEFHARGIVFNDATVIPGSKYDAGVRSPMKAQHLFGAVDCSMYDVIKIIVYLQCTEYHGVDVSFVTAKCYYA